MIDANSATQAGEVQQWLPNQLLEVLLAHMDADTLVCQAPLVCRQWHDLIHSSDAVWVHRLDPALLRLHRGMRRAPVTSALHAKTSAPGLSAHNSSTSSGGACNTSGSSLLRLYLACQARNFLRNPTFSKTINWTASPLAHARRPWVLKESGQAAVFENPPQGVCHEQVHSYPPPPLPDRPGDGLGGMLQGLVKPECPGCLATPQDWAEVVQVVDFDEELQARGLSSAEAAAVLAAGLPLGLSLMVASHHQHAATFAVGLLLDDGKGPVPNPQSFVAKPSRHHFFSGKKYLSPGSGWVRFAYVLPACPPGFKRVVLLLRGRQASTAATVPGPFGVKFASASLQFLAAQDIPAFKENASDSKWRKSSTQGSSEDNVAL